MNEAELIQLILGGVYWIAIIRILNKLNDGNFMGYIPFINIFTLSNRVGFRFLYWVGAAILSFGVGILFSGDPVLSFWGFIVVWMATILLFWLQVTTHCQKPAYLAYLQLVPIVNLWALWEMGNIDSQKQSHGVVLQGDYDARVSQWMAGEIKKGIHPEVMAEQLKEHNLSEERFAELYKRANIIVQVTQTPN